jgi:hypothetical protein
MAWKSKPQVAPKLTPKKYVGKKTGTMKLSSLARASKSGY